MATATSSTTTNNNNIAASPETPFYFKQEQEETTISSITTSSSQSTNADKNYIPRPKNCFMAYREHIKEKFLIENPGINNKVVSVLAANMWNNEPEDVKEHWREQTKLKDSITNGATVTATTTNININNITTNIISNNSSNTTNTTTTNDTTSITNCRKKNVVDSKMIFADGFNNEIMCGDDNSNNKDDVKQKQPIYSLGLEGIATADDHEDIYLQHLQKKAIFGHYRSSSVDSLSSWTSDSTVSTPLLSPFAGSPASLSPPTFQCNNSIKMTKDLSVQSQDLDEFEISPTKAGVFSNAPSPPHFSLIDSDNEFDEGDKTDEENNEENSMFSNDINEVSFGKQSKTEFNGN
ncbi:1435_t:CDS:2 [Entrophospora sp. SA101]|nr:1435_t:CDS:2 [Entrophospora sp. SA101]